MPRSFFEKNLYIQMLFGPPEKASRGQRESCPNSIFFLSPREEEKRYPPFVIISRLINIKILESWCILERGQHFFDRCFVLNGSACGQTVLHMAFLNISSASVLDSSRKRREKNRRIIEEKRVHAAFCIYSRMIIVCVRFLLLPPVVVG